MLGNEVQPLVVPEKFNRNSAKISSLMPPEQSGMWLLQRMQQQTNLASYATAKVLDFGCGVRFSQAILNTGLSIGRYVGVDCFLAMIDYLRTAVKDPRFSYHFLDARHAMYNPGGAPLSSATSLPFTDNDFDLVCMFSVITHQTPADSEAIFQILRRHVAPHGRLFFTAFLDPDIASFEDRSPERNGGICYYHPEYLAALVARCGWTITSTAPSERLIGDSFVCSPT